MVVTTEQVEQVGRVVVPECNVRSGASTWVAVTAAAAPLAVIAAVLLFVMFW
jgi:hypothetical protein